MAACVLHNACLLHDDFDEGYMLDAEDEDNGGDDGDDGNNRDSIQRNAAQNGDIKRSHLTNRIFNNRN